MGIRNPFLFSTSVGPAMIPKWLRPFFEFTGCLGGQATAKKEWEAYVGHPQAPPSCDIAFAGVPKRLTVLLLFERKRPTFF